MLAKIKTNYVCRNCHYVSPVHLGKCPECNSWNSFEAKQEAPKTAAPAFDSNMHSVPFAGGQTLEQWLNTFHAEEADPPPPSRADALVMAQHLPTDAATHTTTHTTANTVTLRAKPLSQLSQDPLEQLHRQPTGLSELDRVLGGGLLAGAYILIGGDPGIGKSTLVLQAAASLANLGKQVLYVAGEESQQQLLHRAVRLGLQATDNLWIASETQLATMLETVLQLKPDVLIVDSVQSLVDARVNGLAGSQSQIKAVAMALMHVAKGAGITTLLIGHVTKEGQLSGPKLLEHMVDTVLYFEGEKYQDLRLLRSVKNRFGSTLELGVFEMDELGLHDVTNPSQLFVGGLGGVPQAGCVTVCTLEGSRPLLVELQALVGPSAYSSPRRVVNGVDSNRVHQIVAVLERRVGVSFAQQDIYLNVAGGLKTDEPASDLGIALALLGSQRNQCVKPSTVLIGEIGLTGELRPVRRWRDRLHEACQIGYRRVVFASPKELDSPALEAVLAELPAGVQLLPVRHVRDAIIAAMDSVMEEAIDGELV
ncbi:MAG: DNA repair protein RadA [Vampirovibrionales bacterium]